MNRNTSQRCRRRTAAALPGGKGSGYQEALQAQTMRIGGATRVARLAAILLCAQEAAAWVGPFQSKALAPVRVQTGELHSSRPDSAWNPLARFVSACSVPHAYQPCDPSGVRPCTASCNAAPPPGLDSSSVMHR